MAKQRESKRTPRKSEAPDTKERTSKGTPYNAVSYPISSCSELENLTRPQTSSTNSRQVLDTPPHPVADMAASHPGQLHGALHAMHREALLPLHLMRSELCRGGLPRTRLEGIDGRAGA